MKKMKIRPLTVLIYIMLSLIVVVYLAPLLWMLSVSFKTNAEVFASPFGLPEVFQWDNYYVAWTAGKLGIATLNSVLVCGITLIASMLIGSMAAFAIGRMRWKLANPTLTYFMIGMMIPVHCVLIPLFVRFSKLGMTNNLLTLILPYVTFSLPMTIYIMVGFSRACRESCLKLPVSMDVPFTDAFSTLRCP